jgi:hypothetical protein
MSGRIDKRAAAMAAAPEPSDLNIAAELSALDGLDLDALRSRWLKVTGRPAPRAFRSTLLRRALAHEIQVAAFGGLPSAVKRRLRQLAAAARDGRFEEVLGTSSIKPGTLLIRVWQGTTHRVMVLADGYAWNGITYGSLSSIAKAITGTNWNGWLFFGLKRDERNKNAAKTRPSAETEAAHA